MSRTKLGSGRRASARRQAVVAGLGGVAAGLFFAAFALPALLGEGAARMEYEALRPGDVAGVVTDASLNVLHVEPENAAGRAGMQRGDRITSVGGTTPSRAGDVVAYVRQQPPSAVVPFTVSRGGSEVTLTVRLAPPGPRGTRTTAAATPTAVAQSLFYF